MNGAFDNNAQRTITDTDGDVTTVTFASSQMKVSAIADEDSYGILIGSGATAVTLQDYFLGSQLTDAAGWRHYVVTRMDDNTENTGTGVVMDSFYRQFKNNTGGAVDVKEAALVVAGDSASERVCIARWLTGTINVTDGESIVIYCYPKTTM